MPLGDIAPTSTPMSDHPVAAAPTPAGEEHRDRPRVGRQDLERAGEAPGGEAAPVAGVGAAGAGRARGFGIAARAWFKKCHFQVTPEIDRALMVKGFLVLGVALI